MKIFKKWNFGCYVFFEDIEIIVEKKLEIIFEGILLILIF